MNYFAVIDTNVIVSALLNPSSVPGRILKEALDGRITPLLNDEILDEYENVLNRPKFRFDKRDVAVATSGLTDRGVFVDAGPIEDIVNDPKDVVFYAVVMEKRETDDAYLVTGNIKHFPVRPFVVTPREMLEMIDTGAT